MLGPGLMFTLPVRSAAPSTARGAARSLLCILRALLVSSIVQRFTEGAHSAWFSLREVGALHFGNRDYWFSRLSLLQRESSHSASLPTSTHLRLSLALVALLAKVGDPSFAVTTAKTAYILIVDFRQMGTKLYGPSVHR